MNSRLNALDRHQLANVIGYAVVTSGLVEVSKIRADYNTWKQSSQTEPFGSFLVAAKRVSQEELSAIMTIAGRTFSQAPETIQEETTTWLRGEIELSRITLMPTSSPSLADAASESEFANLPDLPTISSSKSAGDQRFLSDEGGERFTIVAPHRAGGLGEVFIARDTQFNRQVALKRIKPRYLARTQLCNRFVVEAELTGGLEHPGIVPVYGLGHSADGTPFYAMKFVQGQSLGDAIKSFYAKPNSSLDSIEFRKLLRRFVTVCYTIHYSHSRGILHRDIKPDNIMLGDFDETLVVDWGIAKVMGEKKEGDTQLTMSSSLYPASKRRSDNTQVGQIIGSPGFMSGEQALGWHDSLSPQSDVFSLGATLYTMLVGEPPFAGNTVDEALQNTIAGVFIPPRQLNARIPKPLEVICLQAMQSTKSKRYPTALAMAEDIEAYLADEPVSAWQEPLVVRTRRWMRKHKTAVTTGLTGLLLLTIGAIAASALLAAANTREAAAREKATGNFIIAKSVIDDFLKQLADDPRLESASLEELTAELLTKAENLQVALEQQNQGGYSFDLDRADTEHRIAAVASKLGQSEKAIEHLESARKLLIPHLNDKQDAVRAQTLMTQVLLDYCVALTKAGRITECLALHDEALKLSETRIKAKTDLPSALAGKILHLNNKDIAQRGISDLTGLEKSREQFWQTVNEFFELPADQIQSEQTNIARVVLQKVAISEQERDSYQKIRLACVALLEESTKSAAGETLSEMRTKAQDSTALASAYATMDEKKKSYEAGMASANRWYELAGKTPNVIAFKRLHIWSAYNAFIVWQEYETSVQNAEKGLATRLDLKQVKEIYERASKMFRPFEQPDPVNDVEVVVVYAHLLSNIARYLELHNEEPELVDELLERAIELQEEFDVEQNKNALIVRNEIMRVAGIHYMTTDQKEKGRDVFDREAIALEKTLEKDPHNFVLHRQLYDLRIVGMILENAMDPDAKPEAREKALALGLKAETAIRAIPDSLRKSQTQQILGMYSRLTAMMFDFLVVAGRYDEAQASLDLGVKELLDNDTEISTSGPAIWVAELAKMSVITSLAKSDYQSPVPILDYLLAKVNLPPNAKVFALASRAKCHARLGRPDLAESDCRTAMTIVSRADDEDQLRHAVSALFVAESIASRREKEAGDAEKVKFFDDYARDVLLQKWNAGLLAKEYLPGVIRDMPARLNDVSDLEPLMKMLEESRSEN